MRAFRYRFYPTPEQADMLNRTFGCVRHVWNQALEYRTQAWFERQERITYVQLSAMMTQWRKDPERPWLADVAYVPLQQCLRHQQTAFTNFFEKRAGYPKFKSKHHHRGSAEYTRSAFRWDGEHLTLAKMSEPLDVVWSRPLPKGQTPSTVTVTRDPAGRWFVSMLCEDAVKPLPKAKQAVGIDLGLSALATLSTGEQITNHQHARSDHARLRREQRRLARKEKGSKNREKQRVKVARVHAHITDRRRDQLHKLTTRLVRENQTIVIEDLAVRNMVRNRRLARSISDAGWYELRRQLTYKAEWYGRELIVLDRFYPSSKRCHVCGHILEHLSLNVREWTCPMCSAAHDRDINAAKNILAAGLAVTACGATVRPKRLSRGRRGVEAGRSRK